MSIERSKRTVWVSPFRSTMPCASPQNSSPPVGHRMAGRTGEQRHRYAGASIIANVKQRPPQPETVTALLPRLHVENAAAMRQVDALRAWLRDNILSTALPVSMRGNGYGILL